MSSVPLEHAPARETLDRGYEPWDTGIRGIGLFVFFFYLGIGIIVTCLWGLVNFYTTLQRDADLPVSTVTASRHFSSPHLQPAPQHNRVPEQDLAALREKHRAQLLQMGWIPDPAGGELVPPPQIVTELAHRYVNRAADPPATGEASR